MELLPRNNGLPLYSQLAELLREKIVEGELAPGEKLPSETQLAEMYGVSRITTKQALNELAAQGLIYRLQGSGSYVSPKRLKRQLSQLGGFSEDMRRNGVFVRRKVLELNLSKPPKTVRSRLKLAEREMALVVRRLIIVDQEPIALFKSYLPEHLVRGLLLEDLEENGLYELLQNKLGLCLGWADQILEIGSATTEEAYLLSVSTGVPVFRTTRNTNLCDGTPIETAEAVFRGDRVEFHTRLEAAQGQGGL
ncbi:GntR family transcriptional regulator [Gelria sp. Kuro-4]|uniref:GntR family transcriptional regulator n=1 Tax=Gelria sp. Kuro-4 TaxID=2796927 RepID=UPI001BEE264D|nr:GntR family transcriptional regulator [Gelria sp. Kuro-4]BCV24882.1 transcriptional regulator [Gelria sp. Kuro-4]